MDRMTKTVVALYSAFRQDHAGEPPKAIRLHPADWDRLRMEVSRDWMMLDPVSRKFMGMIPLIDGRWKEGFPVCLGTAGAAEAIEAGARQA